MDGWIKLHRRLVKSSFYRRSTVVHLFVHLLLHVNTEANKFYWNKEEITIQPGQLITGRNQLSEDTGISVRSVRTALEILKSTSTITIKPTNKFSIISILKWEEYQSKPTNIMTSRLTNNRPTTDQQLTTNKNNKNKKNNTGGRTESSKTALVPCTDTELELIASSLQVALKDVRLVHQQILDSIADGTFQKKGYGQTVYFTLRKWIGMRISDGKLRVINSVPKGYKPYESPLTSN